MSDLRAKLNGMPWNDLRREAKQYGLKASGKKVQIIDAILEKVRTDALTAEGKADVTNAGDSQTSIIRNQETTAGNSINRASSENAKEEDVKGDGNESILSDKEATLFTFSFDKQSRVNFTEDETSSEEGEETQLNATFDLLDGGEEYLELHTAMELGGKDVGVTVAKQKKTNETALGEEDSGIRTAVEADDAIAVSRIADRNEGAPIKGNAAKKVCVRDMSMNELLSMDVVEQAVKGGASASNDSLFHRTSTPLVFSKPLPGMPTNASTIQNRFSKQHQKDREFGLAAVEPKSRASAERAKSVFTASDRINALSTKARASTPPPSLMGSNLVTPRKPKFINLDSSSGTAVTGSARGYTPYIGPFNYHDTSKMSDREFGEYKLMKDVLSSSHSKNFKG